jgi:hypothetical protein
MILMHSIIIINPYAFVELEKQIEQKKIAKDMELRKEQEREERENQRILKEQQLLKEREEREILNERMNKQASLNTTDPSQSKPNSATLSSSSSSIAPTQSLPLSARSADIAAVRKPITPTPIIVSEPLYSIPEGTDRSSSLGNTFGRSSPVGDMNTTVTAAVRGQTTSAQSSSSSSSFHRDNRNHLFNKIDNYDNDNDVNDDRGYSNNSNRDFNYNNEVVVPNKVPSDAAVVSKQNTYTPRIDQNQQQQNDGSLMNKGNWNHLFDKNNDNGFDNGIGYSKPSSTVANRNLGNDRNKLFDQHYYDDDDHSNNNNNNNNNNPMISRTNDHGSKGSLLFDSASVFRTDDVMHATPPIMSRQKKQLNHINSQIDHDDDDIQAYSESRSHHRDGRLHQVDHNDSHRSNDNGRPKQLDDRIDTRHHTSIIQQQQKQSHHGISISDHQVNQNYTRGDHLFASSSSTSINQSEQQQQRILTPPLSPTKKKVEHQLLSKLNLSSINSARGYNVVRETKAQPSTHYPDTNATNANAAVFGNHHQLLAHHSNNKNRGSNPNKNDNISLNRTLEFESKFLLPDGTLIDNNRSNNSKGKSSVDDDDDDVLDQLIRSSDAYRGDKEKKKDGGSSAAAAVSYTSSSTTTNRGGDRTSAGSLEILSDIQDTLQSLQHLDDDDDDVYDDRKVTNSKGNSTLIQSTANKGHQQKQSQAANVDTSSSSVPSIVKRPKSSDSLNRDYDVLHVNKRNNRKLELLRKINGANQIQASHLLSSFDQLDITAAAHNSTSNYSSRPSTTNSMSSSNSYSRPNSAHIKVSNILQQHVSRNGTTINNRNGSDSARYRYDNIHQSTHDLQDMRSLYNNNHKRRSHLPSPDDPDFDNYSDYGL